MRTTTTQEYLARHSKPRPSQTHNSKRHNPSLTISPQRLASDKTQNILISAHLSTPEKRYVSLKTHYTKTGKCSTGSVHAKDKDHLFNRTERSHVCMRRG